MIATKQQSLNYQKIALAIEYLHTNYQQQPSLESIAAHINLSPFHFQRLFSEWVGVSPKKFLQYTSLQHAKSLLNNKLTLFDTSIKTGLSSTGRLHDLFVKIEGMTPKEYKNKGENLTINYRFEPSIFGNLLIGSTNKGICYMGFSDTDEIALSELKNRFSKATFVNKTDSFQQTILQVFSKDWGDLPLIKLHLKGTDFQLKVWEALLQIPTGNLTSYGSLATKIGKPKASRAVGTAIGNNPIAFLIPCHRVIQATGKLGGYMWGTTRKSAIIGWESSNKEL